MVKIYNTNCLDYMKSDEFNNLIKEKKVCIVADPPFNINYHYNTYKDKMKESDYLEFIKKAFVEKNIPFVIIHYPETIYKLVSEIKKTPIRVVSWVYNSNTNRQHRDIAFFDIKPDFKKVLQPYKNLNDKRIKERIAKGKLGSKLYDWWNINQVKNVSKNKNGINHPCVMPVEIMRRIIGILPQDYIIFDPFAGSGTTGIACIELNRDFIGCEIDKEYFKLCEKRLKEIKR